MNKLRRSHRSTKAKNPRRERILKQEEDNLIQRKKVTQVNTEYEIVRCLICGVIDSNYDENKDEGGDMIECETCLTWQHINCMFSNTEEIHGSYQCEFCDAQSFKLKKKLHKLEPMSYFKSLERATRIDISRYMPARKVSTSNDYVIGRTTNINNDYQVSLMLKMTTTLNEIYKKHMLSEIDSSDLQKHKIMTQEKFVNHIENYLFRRFRIGNNIANIDNEYLQYFEFLKALLTEKNNFELKRDLLSGILNIEDFIAANKEDLSIFSTKKNNERLIITQNSKTADNSKKGNTILFSEIDSLMNENLNNMCSKSKTGAPSETDKTCSPEVRLTSNKSHNELNTAVLIWKGILEYAELPCLPIELSYFGENIDLAFSLIDMEKPITVEGTLDLQEGESYLNEITSRYSVIVAEINSPELTILNDYYNYFVRKCRYGVIKSKKDFIKDIYLVPKKILKLDELPTFLNRRYINYRKLLLVFVVNDRFQPDLKDIIKTKKKLSSDFISEFSDNQETTAYLEQIFKDFPESKYNINLLYSLVDDRYKQLKTK